MILICFKKYYTLVVVNEFKTLGKKIYSYSDVGLSDFLNYIFLTGPNSKYISFFTLQDRNLYTQAHLRIMFRQRDIR